MGICFGILTIVLLVLAFGQAAAAVSYARRITRYAPVELPDEELPMALVILTLRGGDESLRDCLDRLARQDYPRYEVRIVLDHPTDPARAVVERWRATNPPVAVTVEFLAAPSPTSTLKCSAIHQVLRTLDDRFQAVVLLDSDVQPYPRWLRDLVSPLSLPGVGAVTGNRWYFPRRGSWGSWCRFIYNGLTLPPMDWFQLAWAGSLAMRGDVARSAVLLETLQRSSSDEAAVWEALQQRHLRLHFNPQVIVWNSESTDLSGCHQFLFRQLLWTRLYHPAWPGILAHALGSYLLLAVAFLAVAAGLGMAASRLPATALGVALALYLGSVLLTVGHLHHVIRRAILPRQGVPEMARLGLGRFVWIAASAPLILALYTWAILRAALARRVQWRGIEYRIQPPDTITVVAYRPYRSPPIATSRHRPAPLGVPSHPKRGPVSKVHP